MPVDTILKRTKTMKLRTINAICLALLIIAGLAIGQDGILVFEPHFIAPTLTMDIEAGLIPGHAVSLYPTTDLQEIVNLDLSFYTDMEFKAAWRYGYVSGGMTAYEWADRREIRNFIPFRMDYLMGAGLTFGGVTIGWAHGCFHRVLPGAMIYPYGGIDSGYDRIFIKAEISKKL
jgi:hypothetical protein